MPRGTAARRRPTCAAASTTRSIWRACSSREGCVRRSRVWGCRHEGARQGQRHQLRAGGGAARASRVFPARRLRVDRHARRLRYVELRLLRCRHGRRAGGKVLLDVRGAGRRPRDSHRRGAGRRRQAARAPARVLGSAWPAVRILHARDAADVVRAAETQRDAQRSRHSRGPRRQPVPVHRLSEHREGRAAGGWRPARIGRRELAGSWEHSEPLRRASLARLKASRSASAGKGTTMSIQAKPLHSVGVPMKRKEDPRFIQGKGHYVDDLSFPGMLYLSLVRSTYPHAEIRSIDITEALKVPGVKAVITGKDLEAAGLGWLPTFHGFDKQMVLAIGKVLFQYQEVAAVFAETRAAAVDGAEAVQVDYAPLPVVADPFTSKADKVLLRPDRESKTNRIFHWEVGDKDGAARALASSARRIKQRVWFQRCHPAPLEPCGCVAYFDTMGRLQFHVTSQAPHVYRTALALVTGIAEDKIHVISPDLGGGFGNKVPVYPGYVCAIVGALKIGRPVKWIETRTENLTSTGFARDYHMDVEIGATADGRVTALRVATTADHGAFDAAADPSRYPAGIFGIVTGSYDFPVAYAEVDAFFTNKAPGGIAYRCSFRVTEASYAIERGMDILADELGMDAAELRRKNFIRKEQFPYPSALGFTYDSGDYHKTLDVALERIGYDALLKEQAEKRVRGELMGIGLSTFTEVVGAGPSKHFDILGIRMFDSAEIRIHPTGAGIVRTGTKSQGQGHETTWAQIVAEELGLDAGAIMVEEGDTDTAPYGLGTYASRSTPVAGAAITMAARRIREKARKIAAHLLEAGEADVEWTDYRFQVKGVPARSVTMKEVAFAAYTNMAQNEPGLEATYYYDPPNMTYPNGAYVAVVDVDRETGEVKVRRFVAVDDCGVVINPMVVEGQIHGGLTEGFAMAFTQEIQYDAEGNNLSTNFTDYLVPTSLETPHWETAGTVTPSPHHPMGAKGVGESPNVGSPAAFVNAVVDALSPLGVRHIDMPMTRDKVWRAIRDAESTKG